MPFFTDSDEVAVEGLGAARRIGWMRFVGASLAALPIASVGLERGMGRLAFVFLLVNALVWPAIAQLLTRRAARPAVVQFRCMVRERAQLGRRRTAAGRISVCWQGAEYSDTASLWSSGRGPPCTVAARWLDRAVAVGAVPV